MCNIPFSIIENPWFIDLIKTLQPGYDPPSRQVLNGTLLESETSRVNICIMNELSADNNFTIVGAKKFVAIVSDNGSNVAAACKIITNNYPNIINVRCITHCVNLISTSIVKIDEVKYIVRCANILTKYFKNSTLRSSWLNETIKSKNIEGGGLKTYVETRWMTVYECTGKKMVYPTHILHISYIYQVLKM
ncbi:hypothetical protein RirG_129040 [Rhizophagus irregularis DAOM 197198w]|uniref:DUF659 domain-containing protein n=1 Tax=Rhizophagus irregularis (strain DAOM 197198w) TaxID=1432141 RepID=A0A015KEJ0_RHIIW|nr:hypothetical protein RirG_129040 [Rhizophagus irregularis DAOM 197198w]